MIFRFARLEDKEAILRLLDELSDYANLQQGIVKHSKKAQLRGGPIFEKLFQREDIKFFVAEEKKEVVGLATFYYIPSIRRGMNRGQIEDFIVTQKIRGQGIGKGLFMEVMKYCKKSGVKIVKLTSGLELKSAHAFYEKNGGIFTGKLFKFEL